jgi:hypothetical protein
VSEQLPQLPPGAIPGRNGGYLMPQRAGQPSHNPKGRPSAGSSIIECINDLATAALEHGLTEDDLRVIAEDKEQPWPKRAAARRIIRSFEDGDLADFDEWLSGEASGLAELRKKGINTQAVKKAKVKILEGGVVEREIELHDRSGADFDRILDRTEGKATQRVEHAGDVGLTVKRVILELPEGTGE